MRSAAARCYPLSTQLADHGAGGRAPRAGRRAVTLIELTIVLLIMGIFAAVATPTFYDSLIYHRVESAARRLMSDFQLVQQSARLTSRAQSITFDNALSYVLSADIVDPDHPDQAYAVDLSEPPYQLGQMTIDFGGDTSVSFDGYGTPSQGGTIYLQAGNYACKLALDGATGHVTRSDTLAPEEIGL